MSSNIHRRQLFGGRAAEEVHAEYAFPPNAKCVGCGGRPMVRGIVMMELDEAKKNPALSLLMKLSPEDFVKQLVKIRGSDGKPENYVRVSATYACKSCAPTMEKALAKAPSHCIVEINRIRPSRFVSGRAGGSEID